MSPPATLATLASLERDRATKVATFADEYPFAPHFHELAGGLRLHYVDEGPRDADPMLFVHGYPTWSFYWRNLIQAFSGDHRCVAVDHIGCGFSDKPEDWSYRLSDHVANLEALILALDLRRITLVVHDWGGPIGLGFAERHKDRIARLIVLNTAAFPNDSWGGRAPLRIRACLTPVLGNLAVRGLNAFARMATVMAVEKHDHMTPTVKAGFLAPYDTYANRIATLRFVEDIPLKRSHPSYATLAGIANGLAALRDLPMCLIWGERDWCFTPAFRAEWQRRFPAARVHTAEDAGHYVVEDAAPRVVEWIRAFAEDHPLDESATPAPEA